MTNPDVSGMLRFLTDELQDAEDAGDRGKRNVQSVLLTIAHGICLFFAVWILGHVLSGWTGSDALENPSNLCECSKLRRSAPF